MTRSLRILVLIWIAWAAIIIGFQTLVTTRLQPDRPDYATMWSDAETQRNSQRDWIYLTEPFMNRQVSFDSEYYLSIAVAGYGDEASHNMTTRGGQRLSLTYAFFPLYPFTTRAVAAPLSILGMNPIATATLAGVIVSLLGTLGGMVALYHITRDELGDEAGIRTAFYLLIFPSSFFLAMVFSEGLFVGLAFGSLALMRRRQLLLAGILAALATWTRSIGLLLMVPLALSWLTTFDWNSVRSRFGRTSTETPSDMPGPPAQQLSIQQIATGLLAILLPVGAYLIWRQALGREFTIVEEQWFGRVLFDFEAVRDGWAYAIEYILSGEFSARRAWYLLEIAAVIIAAIACLFTLRRYPIIAIFSLLALVLPITTGWPQSLIRYALAVPALYICLSRWGRSTAFDRIWTLASVMILSMQTALFAWDMWVA
jgi:hypothetical protein